MQECFAGEDAGVVCRSGVSSLQEQRAGVVCRSSMQKWCAGAVCRSGLQEWFAGAVCRTGVQEKMQE